MIKFRVHSWLFVVFLIIFFLPTTNYQLPTVYAVDSTPSSSIKNKLQQLQAQIASKAAKLKQEVDRKLKDKSYAGIVKSKSASSITLADTKERVISINQDTVFVNQLKPKSKLSLSTILTKDYIAALGDIDETGVLIAKKVILLPTKNYQLKTYLWGQVMEVAEKSVVSHQSSVVRLKTKDRKTTAVSLPKEQEVKLNEYLILAGIINEKGVFEAEFVHHLKKPTRPALSKSIQATSSTTPSAKSSPSGKK